MRAGPIYEPGTWSGTVRGIQHKPLCCAGLVTVLWILSGLGPAHAEPELEAFLLNPEGITGSSPNPAMHALASQILADVERLSHTEDDIFVETSGVPSYPTGPFPDGNPSYASDQDAVYQITKQPTASGSIQSVGLGVIGIFVNGVAIFNPEDGITWNNQNIWHRNAIFAEADGFDACFGHPAPPPGGPPGPPGGLVAGIYHHHQRPSCLLDQLADTGAVHSPIAGFALDGFPVYGPYGFANSDGSGGVVRIRTGYAPRAITTRDTLPDGTLLPEALHGPDVSQNYPLGWWIEDYEFVAASGDLDPHNGRFAVTPEFPEGTYAYWMSIDANGASEYPYFIGPTYYGEPIPQFGVSVPPDAVVYVPEPALPLLSLAAQITLASLLAVSTMLRRRRTHA